jgi:hypothetical protein
MNMYARTPGPWEARRDPSHFDTLSSVVGGSARAGRIDRELMVEVGGRGTVGSQEANTRLIAAAPELLEALELAITRLDTNHSEDLAVYDKAKAAISKAKGES